MKYAIALAAVALVAGFSQSSASAAPSGQVLRKVNESEVHASLGRTQVQEGDKVGLKRSVCPRSKFSSPRNHVRLPRFCRVETAGSGEVAGFIGSDSSVVKFPPGTDVEKGDIVDRK